jgi:hypothetical protein
MAKSKTIVCLCGCGREKSVRAADIARGWGKYFSKSCKAKHQERRTGATAKYYRNQEAKEDPQQVSMQSGYFGHGQD